MAVSVVSVCNSALIKIGAARISSITQDTKSAIALNAIFAQIRDEVMAAHPWNFAIKRATLAPTSTEPEYEFDYEYDKPSDMLRILNTYPDDIDYQEENNKILTSESELLLRYIYRQDDPSTWSPGFAEALAWRLAREVCYNLTGNATMVQVCDEGYKKALAEARFVDGSVGTPQVLEADLWTQARR